MPVINQNIQDLINTAKEALKTASYKEAEEQFAKAKELLETQKDSREKDALSAAIENGLSTLAWRKGDYDQARQRAERALDLARNAEDKESEGGALRNIGVVYFYLSDYATALEFFQKGLEIYEEAGYKQGVAINLGDIGSVYTRLSDYPKAIEYSRTSLEINEEIGDQQGVAHNLAEIGVVYLYLSDYAKALEFLQKALDIFEEIGDKRGLTRNLGNVGIVFSGLSDYAKALEFYQKALEIFEEIGDQPGVANGLLNIGTVYISLSDYIKALEFFQQALKICEEIGDKRSVAFNLGNIGIVYGELSDYAKALEFIQRALEINKEIGDKHRVASNIITLGDVLMKIAPPDYPASEEQLKNALTLCKSLGIRKEEAECLEKLSELCRLQERWKEADAFYRQFHEISAEIFTLEAKKQADNFAIQREIQEKEKQQAVVHAATQARYQATESLLLRVLPSQIAERMLEGEDQIADYYASTSILFADIQGFTALTADLPPYLLLQLLHAVFTRFDHVVKEAGCTKIKSIGDGYMAVSGAPEKCDDHAERIVRAAEEMIKPIKFPDEVEAFMPEVTELQIRIGIHTGPVIAGVVGQDAFGYDIYSDAVNIASRMETTGEAGRIHVSADFMRHLLSRFAMTRNQDHGITFEKRGEMEVKGKGMMKTFFLCR